MHYLAVQWLHDHADDPILLFSELDEDRNEVRKVEVFPDGCMSYADVETEVGETRLSSEPIPALDEIAADPQFSARVISSAAFEQAWRCAVERDAARPSSRPTPSSPPQ